MKLSLRRDGVEIGQTYAGLSISVDGLFVSPVDPEWSLTVPEDSEFPLPGFYDFEEIPEVELEQTPEDIRALMPTVSPTQFPDLLKTLISERYPDGVKLRDVFAVIEQIPDENERDLALWDMNRATVYERSNQRIDTVGGLLGFPPEDLDTAWMNFVGAPA